VKPVRTLHLPALLPLLAGLAGCVVPVGPEWTDPAKNYPPTIASATPAIGTVLTLAPDAGGPLTVDVVLADQNTSDKLYFRWIIDYPPFVDGVSHLARPDTLPGGNQIQRGHLLLPLNCTDDRIAPGFTNHRLMLAASDRPFVMDEPGQTVLDKVQDGSSPIEAVWPFEMDCP
jgi:hypothetical protein